MEPGLRTPIQWSGLKIKAKWEEGDKLVKGVAIAKKKVTNTMGTVIPAANRYYYMLAVTVADSNSTSDADVIGTLTLNKTKSPKVKGAEAGNRPERQLGPFIFGQQRGLHRQRRPLRH